MVIYENRILQIECHQQPSTVISHEVIGCSACFDEALSLTVVQVGWISLNGSALDMLSNSIMD
jgi:hypothetical protein